MKRANVFAATSALYTKSRCWHRNRKAAQERPDNVVMTHEFTMSRVFPVLANVGWYFLASGQRKKIPPVAATEASLMVATGDTFVMCAYP